MHTLPSNYGSLHAKMSVSFYHRTYHYTIFFLRVMITVAPYSIISLRKIINYDNTIVHLNQCSYHHHCSVSAGLHEHIRFRHTHIKLGWLKMNRCVYKVRVMHGSHSGKVWYGWNFMSAPCYSKLCGNYLNIRIMLRVTVAWVILHSIASMKK